MKILAIESSCDETALALLTVTGQGFKLDKQIVSSQVALHSRYGGVVPELAARMHLETLLPLLDKTIGRTRLKQVDLIAVTSGPGLITSLMVGTETAKALSFALNKPLVGINHLEGHIYANWLSHPELFKQDKKIFPAVVLVVSGGHTELVLMKGHGKYQLLGQTVDDAAGEAFDKVAKILDLGYPGGPIISALAKKGNPQAVNFPRPMIKSPDLQFSFSGLKTSVLYYAERLGKVTENNIADIVASFQQAVIDVLAAKMVQALEKYPARSLMLAGGVSANEALRQAAAKCAKQFSLPVYYPTIALTGDNAAMIAAAAYYHRKDKGLKNNWQKLKFEANWKLASNKSRPGGPPATAPCPQCFATRGGQGAVGASGGDPAFL